MQASLSRYLHPAPGVVGQLLAGEAVVILPHQGQVKVLNEVGAAIWARCDGRHTVGDIARVLAATYDVGLEEAEGDILAFVDELVTLGMVSLEPYARPERPH